MAKKKLKGIVTLPFKTQSKTYNIGDIYETNSKESIEILIKSKRIKI